MRIEQSLYEESKGDVLEAYLLLKGNRGTNVPPAWIERYHESRKKVEHEVGKILKKKNLDGYATLKDWVDKFQKECFYRGIRALMEIERQGKTKY